jgi:hypothetical protein
MRGGQSQILSGLILRQIFDRNQEQFTAAEPKTIPTIAVVEEAQSVLNENSSAAEPYIAWVKEGRKYDLGALLITQQPGSLPQEILSQGDNWFIFHLLSAGDLVCLKRANAHFSDDLLSSLLNEPIPGQGVYWSSVGEKPKPYPVSFRAWSFEKLFALQDPYYNKPAGPTFTQELLKSFHTSSPAPRKKDGGIDKDGNDNNGNDNNGNNNDSNDNDGNDNDGERDLKKEYESQAILALKDDADLRQRIDGNGVPWGQIIAFLKKRLPQHLFGLDNLAFNLVPKALNEIYGPQNQKWVTFKHPTSGATWIRTKKNE